MQIAFFAHKVEILNQVQDDDKENAHREQHSIKRRHQHMDNCLFCKIIAGDIPSYKIYENDLVYAFLDIAKDCPGHTLVVPKKHCVNILDCPTDTLTALTAAAQHISRHYVNNCGFSGIDIMNANGIDADQSVFHLHFHILPRKAGDNVRVWDLTDKFEYSLADMAAQLALPSDK
jgi:histidine triad (HIT) family protein